MTQSTKTKTDLDKKPIAISSDAFYFEKDKSQSILILGVGNFLMGDEGVGVHLIQEMDKLELPSYVDILDGGTGGFLLLNCFESYNKIIFVDATMDGKEVGTISLLRPKFASDFPFTISIEKVVPMTTELAPKVKNAIPKAIEQIISLSKTLREQIP